MRKVRLLDKDRRRSLKKHIKIFNDYQTLKDLEEWFGHYLKKPDRPSFPLFIWTNDLDQVCVELNDEPDFIHRPKEN